MFSEIIETFIVSPEERQGFIIESTEVPELGQFVVYKQVPYEILAVENTSSNGLISVIGKSIDSKFYYTVEIDRDEDSKWVSVYIIVDNEPQLLYDVDLDLQENSKQHIRKVLKIFDDNILIQL